MSVVLSVRVTPRAPRAVLGSGRGGVLSARVTSPPVAGAANAAVIALVADAMGVPRRDVCIVGGERSRDKRVAIDGDPAMLAEAVARIVRTP